MSGDMFLGALVDTGVPVRLLEETVAALNVGGRLEISRVERSGISATKVDVYVGGEKELPREVYWEQKGHSHARDHAHPHDHEHVQLREHNYSAETKEPSPAAPTHQHEHGRGLKEIREVIRSSKIAESAKQTAIAIFETLGAAEAKIHNTDIEKIHFHEVGAIDAIVDIVCASVGAEALGVDEWICSPLNVGGGTVVLTNGNTAFTGQISITDGTLFADPRAESLSTRFASQWLRLQDVEKIHPDALLFPSFDNGLAESYKKETELFFDSIVREDRNILDLLTADFTYVNERIARVYRLPNIIGENFRRVTVPDERRGLLGQGSVLMQTAVADRTSPVQRGKWIMEVLLGSPPPPPPPNVPALEDTKGVADTGKLLSTRERMEEHRKNPACTSCHRVIDPLGLALENFDVVGAWRIKDNGAAVDANGVLYDGTRMAGPADLRRALLAHSDSVIRNFTENLMAYAIGRPQSSEVATEDDEA